MYDKKLVIEILIQIHNATEIVSKRFSSIKTSDDFLDSEEGLQLLDAICMQLIAIGESVKNIDKITQKKLLPLYSNIDWKGVMGIRDIITHHYFDIDAEEIFMFAQMKYPHYLSQ
ncbi:MAG: DUF86 domain-containing protein [Candidatus Cloacimonetes bacterium]|nr:DUF86 domain-containing protein [Candidatus Cloacimonadota bacterium]